MDDRMAVGAAGRQQLLHAGNDLRVHGKLVAGEGIAGPGPGIGQIDANQRRAPTEADAALKTALLIDARRRLEGGPQHFFEFPVVKLVHHGAPLADRG
jgi:hypothetical protein